MASRKWSQPAFNHEPNSENWNSQSASTHIPRDRRAGKFHLIMYNVPTEWKWHVVLKYIKKVTDHIDRAIARDITLIQIVQNPQRGIVHFQTKKQRNLAFVVLKNSKEMFFGKQFFFQLEKHDDWGPNQKFKPKNDPPRQTLQQASVDSEAKPQRKSIYISANFHITMENIPQDWTRENLLEYIEKYTNSVDKAIKDDIILVRLKTIAQKRQAFINFRTMIHRNQAYDLLVQANDVFDGRKIEVHKEDKHVSTKVNWSHNAPDVLNFVTDFDRKTIGISKKLLKDLGIDDKPLTNKVLVQFLPFDCEESTVYGIFNMAGSVESVTLLNKVTHCDAIVEYASQIEAVQAVSMFNKQEMYGKEILCEITSQQTTVEGMILGPGLGPNGTPLKGINLYIEMQKIKNDFIKEKEKIMALTRQLDADIYRLINENIPTNVVYKSQTSDITQNVPNPITVLSNLLISQSCQSQNQAKRTDKSSQNVHSNLEAQVPDMQNQIRSTVPNLTVETDVQNRSQDMQISPQGNIEEDESTVLQFKNNYSTNPKWTEELSKSEKYEQIENNFT